MSSRTATAVKALLEGVGLGIPGYADRPPPGRQPPYWVVHELIGGAALEGHGDFGDPNADEAVAELGQVDIVQRIKDPAGRAAEDSTIPDRIALALRGARLPTAPNHVYGVRVNSIGPRVSLNPNVAQTSITFQIRRALRRY